MISGTQRAEPQRAGRLVAVAPIPAKAGRRGARAFHATRHDGPFVVPPMLVDRVEALLAGRGNAEAGWRLLKWLLASNRLGLPFPVVSEALWKVDTLGLTKGQVRGAVELLVQVGLVERLCPVGGSGFRKDIHGRVLGRKAVQYRFSATVTECFCKAAPARRSSRVLNSQIARPSVSKNSFMPVLKSPETAAGLPMAPKGHSAGAQAGSWAPDPERAAALAFLGAGPQAPLPLLSAAALNAGRHSSYGRRPGR